MAKLVATLLFLICSCVSADHFYGGTLNWEPVKGVPNTARFRFQLGWRMGHGDSPGCNTSTIGQLQTPQSFQSWQCVSGCEVPFKALAPLSYYCTAIDTLKAFEQGENSFLSTFNQPEAKVGFSSMAWRPLNYAKGGVHKEGLGFLGWNVETSVDLRTRLDKGVPNSSPVVVSRPVYRLRMGCEHQIQLLTRDPDDDVVKCRWAAGEECLDVCNGLPGATIAPDTCTLSVDTTPANGFVKDGYYAVAITVEDHARYGEAFEGTQGPLSGIPLQFLVNVFDDGESCDNAPVLVSPTPAANTRISVPLAKRFSLQLNARPAPSDPSPIVGFTVLGFRGLHTGLVTSDFYFERNDTYTAEVTWTPTDDQVGDQTVCFSADDAHGRASDTRCVTLAVGDVDECENKPCQNGASCVDLRYDYRCDCKPGFTGKDCKTDINECAPQPCDPSAICVDSVNHFTCVCPAGHTGTTCSDVKNPCESSPCLNNATCTGSGNGVEFKCSCASGFTGERCEKDMPGCSSSPCQNGASCINSDGVKYVCECPDGFEGQHCEQKTPIKDNTCSKNSGTDVENGKGVHVHVHVHRDKGHGDSCVLSRNTCDP